MEMAYPEYPHAESRDVRSSSLIILMTMKLCVTWSNTK